MDIVIVFYKHEQTLLRISCLAPSSVMEKFQPIFNDVLVSVKFASDTAAPAPGRLAPAPGGITPLPVQPEMRPPAPSPGRESRPGVESRQPSGQLQTVPPPSPGQPTAPGPRPGLRGPLREPEKPATGIVN